MENLDDEALNICPQCEQYPVGRFNYSSHKEFRDICIRCSFKNQDESRKRKAKQKRIEQGKNVRKIEKKYCEICNNIYMTASISQKNCSPACEEKYKNQKVNSKWKEKEYTAPHKPSVKTEEKLSKSHVYYSNPEWTKKFKTIRG